MDDKIQTAASVIYFAIYGYLVPGTGTGTGTAVQYNTNTIPGTASKLHTVLQLVQYAMKNHWFFKSPY